MNLKKTAIAFLCVTLLLPQLAQAHFLWLVSKSGDEGPQGIHLYFGELAEPDDPALLDRVLSAQIWQLDAAGKKVELKSSKGEESIIAKPVIKEPSVVGLTHDYGVLTRGENSFVLRYYAKAFHNASSAEWNKIDSSKQIPLDITPEYKDEFHITLHVKWNGKPLPNAEIKIEDDEANFEAETTTDENGQFTFPVPKSSLLSIRVKHVEEKEGELDGSKYSSIRHYSTLALPIK